MSTFDQPQTGHAYVSTSLLTRLLPTMFDLEENLQLQIKNNHYAHYCPFKNIYANFVRVRVPQRDKIVTKKNG